MIPMAAAVAAGLDLPTVAQAALHFLVLAPYQQARVAAPIMP
jgi:hypothetical protein